MQINTFKHYGLLGIIILLLTIACTCGSPTEPPPIVEKEYSVYFWFEEVIDSLSIIYRYIPAKNELDTIFIPELFNYFEVSKVEEKLLLHKNGITKVYDTESQQIIGDLPFFGRLSYSPDSQLIAISDGTELNIINADNFSVDYHDTSNIVSTSFTNDNKKLFCFKTESPNVVILDRENNYARIEKQIDSLGGRPIPSKDGTKIFILKHIGWDDSVFEVYDMITDSVIFTHYHSPGHGFMTMTPNGKYVFYTNPGTLLHGTPPQTYFNAYNVETNQLEFINTTWYPDPEIDSLAGMYAQEVAPTADGQWLTAIGIGTGGSSIVAVNISTLLVINDIKISEGYLTYWNLTSTAVPSH